MDTPNPTPAPQATPTPEGQKSGKNILIILLVVIIGLILLGWLASFVIAKVVGTGIKAAIEKSTGVKVDGNGDGGTISFTGADGKKVVIDGNDDSGSITFTGEDGETATFEGGSTTLPADFPSNFPVYSGMKVESTGKSTAQEGTVFMANWTTSAKSTDVSSWYKTEIPKRGWEVVSTTEADGGLMIYFTAPGEAEKKDGGWMTVASDDTNTTVSVWVTKVK